MENLNHLRCAIYGAGSLGTILGAYISASGKQIDLINHNKAHVAALREYGARVVGTRWSKLLINSAFSGMSTVLGCTFGEAAGPMASRT